MPARAKVAWAASLDEARRELRSIWGCLAREYPDSEWTTRTKIPKSS